MIPTSRSCTWIAGRALAQVLPAHEPAVVAVVGLQRVGVAGGVRDPLGGVDLVFDVEAQRGAVERQRYWTAVAHAGDQKPCRRVWPGEQAQPCVGHRAVEHGVEMVGEASGGATRVGDGRWPPNHIRVSGVRVPPPACRSARTLQAFGVRHQPIDVSPRDFSGRRL